MKKILVIDDSPTLQSAVAKILDDKNFDLHFADNGETGLEVAREIKPDLIVCDIEMPKMDGFKTLKAVRSDKELGSIPFIFLTVFSSEENLRTGMEAGADDFIDKRKMEQNLAAAIETQIGKYKRLHKSIQTKFDEVGKNISYALPHEFRTVLNEMYNLANFLKAMSEKISPEEIEEIADEIMHSNSRLLKITENFLVFAQIMEFFQSEEKIKRLRSFRLSEPLANARDIAENVAQKYDRVNNLYVEEGNDDVALEISGENFVKIITELTDNAFKFSEKGSLIMLRTWHDEKKYYFEFSDKGRGMDKEQIRNIAALAQFERNIYEQQGAGLGLIIVKKIIELHGGAFQIESRKDKGTRITFSLCVAPKN